MARQLLLMEEASKAFKRVLSRSHSLKRDITLFLTITKSVFVSRVLWLLSICPIFLTKEVSPSHTKDFRLRTPALQGGLHEKALYSNYFT